QSLVKPFVRGFFTRAEPIHLSSPNRSILEKYRYQKVNIAKVNQQLQERKKREYDNALAGTIVTKTKAYREWEFEMRKMKEETYRRYLDTVDDTHPFLVDDYRMEVVRESRRITDFYKPLIQREADMLSEKRRLGQVHIEPEPFYLEGLDEVIPKIHELLKSEPSEEKSLETEEK
ncbi:hypothetical protein WA577_007634, partial [Blastocystis sp. JDR]